jgi:hypothetical protein
MKKLFIILFMVLSLVITGSAMAGWSIPYDEAHTNQYIDGSSGDDDFYFNWNNDGAMTWGGSSGEAKNFGFGGLLGFGNAFANDYENSFGNTHSGAWGVDFGTTSMTFAGTLTDVTVMANGDSGFCGWGIGAAYNKSEGEIGGDVYQKNFSQEVGYFGGTFAQARNESGASFEGYTKDGDLDIGIFGDHANSSIYMNGKAGTFGGSIVNVDPYGYHQTASAVTGNVSFANVYGADCFNTNVYGSGEVNIGANAQRYNSSAYAGGQAGFSYNGSTVGFGVAGMNADVYTGKNSFNSSVSGFAFSSTGGFDSKQER